MGELSEMINNNDKDNAINEATSILQEDANRRREQGNTKLANAVETEAVRKHYEYATKLFKEVIKEVKEAQGSGLVSPEIDLQIEDMKFTASNNRQKVIKGKLENGEVGYNNTGFADELEHTLPILVIRPNGKGSEEGKLAVLPTQGIWEKADRHQYNENSPHNTHLAKDLPKFLWNKGVPLVEFNRPVLAETPTQQDVAYLEGNHSEAKLWEKINSNVPSFNTDYWSPEFDGNNILINEGTNNATKIAVGILKKLGEVKEIKDLTGKIKILPNAGATHSDRIGGTYGERSENNPGKGR